jgi:hypothetical protein
MASPLLIQTCTHLIDNNYMSALEQIGLVPGNLITAQESRSC